MNMNKVENLAKKVEELNLGELARDQSIVAQDKVEKAVNEIVEVTKKYPVHAALTTGAVGLVVGYLARKVIK